MNIGYFPGKWIYFTFPYHRNLLKLIRQCFKVIENKVSEYPCTIQNTLAYTKINNYIIIKKSHTTFQISLSNECFKQQRKNPVLRKIYDILSEEYCYKFLKLYWLIEGNFYTCMLDPMYTICRKYSTITIRYSQFATQNTCVKKFVIHYPTSR